LAGLEIDSEKPETNRYLIKKKWRTTPSIPITIDSPALELEMDSEKVIDYRDKSIFDKGNVENNAIDYQSIVS